MQTHNTPESKPTCANCQCPDDGDCYVLRDLKKANWDETVIEQMGIRCDNHHPKEAA